VIGRACLLLLAAMAAAARPAAGLERLPAVVHVHSDFSTGEFPLEVLAETAQQQGIGALLLAENYLLRVEYGLPPFRALTRLVHEAPGVLRLGLERYFDGVAEVQRRFPAVLLVPGVEVLPHYYWTGSPFTGSLRLHNSQKNLLVFGLSDPAAVAGLPVIGNRQGGRSVLDALPALLMVPGVVLLARKRARRQRVGRAVVVVRQRSWLAGGVLIVVAAVTVARGWPFTADRYPPWEDFGVAPHQALIDHVEGLGGLAVWSFPEAPDAGEEAVGPLRVRWHTEPYPDDLLRTSRYTAFGGLYEQPTRVVEPGEHWDRLLGQFVRGERTRPAWALGEAGFHGPGDGKRLGPVQTVLLVTERSEPAALDALRRGRLYALARTAEASLVLEEFSVTAGGVTVGSGEAVRVAAGTPVEVRIAVGTTGPALPLRVTLVRNGAVAEAWAGPTPFRVVWRQPADGTAAVFRVDARAPVPHRLLTSPIFVLGP
jgi:hypothetical protein